MDNATEGEFDAFVKPRGRFAWMQRTLGYALAVGGLIWVLHDVHPRELVSHLVLRDWRWCVVAILADILAFLAQGWRWSMLLTPLGKLPKLRATQAIYAGLFTNEMLPLRVGELVRAYLVSRWLEVRFVSVIPSIAVERLLDAVWLALGIGTVALFLPLPRNLENGADIFGVVVLAVALGFTYLVWKAANQRTISRRFQFLVPLASNFRRIAVAGRLWRAALISLLMVALQALAFWLVMPAYGLALPVWAGAVVFLIVHIGTAIPNAPGNVGSYQLFTVAGLTLFGVEKSAAAAFSIVVFVVLTAPLWIIGFISFGRTGLTVRQIRREIRRH